MAWHHARNASDEGVLMDEDRDMVIVGFVAVAVSGALVGFLGCMLWLL